MNQLSKAALPVTGENMDSKGSDGDKAQHIHDITLSQMTFFAHNMRAFGVASGSIETLLHKVCSRGWR